MTLLRRGVLAIAAGKALFALAATLISFARGSVHPGPRVAIMMLLCSTFTLVGTSLGFHRHRDLRTEHFAGFLLLCASSFADALLVPISASAGPLSLIATQIGRIRIEAGLPLFLWWFVRDFPRVGDDTRSAVATVFIRVSLIMGILLAAASAAAESGWRSLALFSRPQPSSLYWPILFTLTLPALAFAVVRSRRATPDERRRVSLLIAGLVGGFAPVVLEVILEALIPALRRATHHPALRPIFAGVIYVGLGSIPFTTAYAVLVHRALGFRLVIRQAIQYAMARWTVVAATALPFLALMFYLWTRRDQTIAKLLTGGPVLFLLIATAMGIIGLVWRRRAFDAIDRRFFREEYDARRILLQLAGQVRSTTAAEGLASMWANEIDRALHVESIALLAMDTSRGRFSPLAGACRPLPVRSKILELVSGSADPTDVDLEDPLARVHALPEEDRAWLADGPFQLLTPIMGTNGSPIGLLALGGKKSEVPFSEEDRLLLGAIASSGAPHLENLLVPRHWAAPARDEERQANECVGCHLVFETDLAACPACGGGGEPAPLPLVLRDKYRVDRRIDEGGMGAVYLGHDLELGRSVAMKVLPYGSPERSMRLRREARVMAAITHPNLAVIHALETWQARPILVLEFLEGGTLQSRIEHHALAVADALHVVSAIAAALERTHAAGFLHRDVKPSNIGFTKDGVPRLLDFGLARLLAEDGSRRKTPVTDASVTMTHGSNTEGVAGTPLYMSPEAYLEARPDPSFDLWSLAVVLYESIAGLNPFSGSSLAEVRGRVIHGEIVPLRQYAPECPETLEAFMQSALSRNARERPASAHAFRQVVDAMLRR